MALIRPLNGISPKFGNNCFFAETAVIIGDVEMGDDCSIWYNAVVRGDVHYIRIGNQVNIQDGAIIHCTYKVAPVNIGNHVSIAHNAIVHGCTIHDHVLIWNGRNRYGWRSDRKQLHHCRRRCGFKKYHCKIRFGVCRCTCCENQRH